MQHESQKYKDLLEIECLGKGANTFLIKAFFVSCFIHSTIGGTYLIFVVDKDDIVKS